MIATGSAEPGSTEEDDSLTGSPMKELQEGLSNEELAGRIQLAVGQLAVDDFHGRWDAVKQFSKEFAEWGDRTIPILIQQLQSQKDPGIQWFLVRILSQFQHPDVVAALAELLLTTDSEDLQQSVSRALSSMDGLAIDTLSALLEPASFGPSTSPHRRILAARTLAHIRRSAVIAPLLSVADDPDAELRAIALEALGSFHDPRITPVLLTALGDHPSICIEAIRTLGRRRDLLPSTDLVSPLQGCLRSQNEVIACESAIALGRLGTQAAIIALGEALGEPLPTKVKSTIAAALGWLNQQSAIAYLTQSFRQSEPFTTAPLKQSIAKALGQTRDEDLKRQAAGPLIDWLVESDLNVSSMPTDTTATPHSVSLTQSIMSSLARLGVPATLESIVPVLAHTDLRLRLHALNAIKQIDPGAAQQRVQQYIQSADVSKLAKQRVRETLAAW